MQLKQKNIKVGKELKGKGHKSKNFFKHFTEGRENIQGKLSQMIKQKPNAKQETLKHSKMPMFFKNIGKNTSIKTRLIIICVLFAVVPLLIVSIVSSSISKSTLRDTSKQLTTDMVNQTRSSVDFFINDIEKNITKYVLNELNVNSSSQGSSLLSQYEMSKDDQTKKTGAVINIGNSLSYLSSVEKNIDNSVLVSDDGTVIGKISGVSPEDCLLAKDMQMKEEFVWQKGLGKDSKNIYFIRKVQNTMIGENFGKMVSRIKIDSIVENIKEIKLLDGANVFISDSTGKMIYSKDSTKEKVDDYILKVISRPDESYSDMENGKLVAYSTASNGWKIIAEIPEAALTDKLDKANTIIWVFVFIAMLIAVLVGMLVSLSFSKPIIGIMKLMKRAESGDLTVEVHETRQDELGMLCESFNNMMANIRKLLADTKVVISDTLDDGKTLKTSTEQSVEAFEQLAFSIEDIAAGSSNQAEDAGESSIAMTTLADSIQKVMRTTKDIFENNQGAKEMIQDAADSVELLNTTMDSSIQISNKIRESITELSTLTKSIEDIMKLVDGISEQTNMLALNASIEAARAGEVGKGFAVVAHEVRNLAEQSKKSTGNVRVTLNTIESKTKDAVSLVKEANNVFANQEQAVKKTYNAFNNIIERLKHMDDELNHVNNQTETMEVLKNEMSNKITRIKTVTEDTASATQEVNALSEQQKAVMEQVYMLANKLTETMDRLSDSIQTFKVE